MTAGTRFRIKAGNTLYGRGGPDAGTTAPTTSRTNPARGTYMPNSPQYAGLLPGWTVTMLEPVYPNASGYISITSGTTYTNKLFWGEVRMRSPTMPTFRNCAFAGSDPNTLVGSVHGAIRCYGSGYYQWLVEDSLFDDMLWLDESLALPSGAVRASLDTWRSNTPGNVGIHGGRGTLRRCEIVNYQDGFNSVQGVSVLGDPVYENAFTLVEDCWIHKMHYYRDISSSMPEGSHSDCFQFSIGKNFTLRGNYFGGVRGNYGDETTGNLAYNPGDDAWNSGIMLKQEVSMAEGNVLENILIEQNFFEGCGYGINHSWGSDRPNMYPTTKIINNYFVRRTDEQYIIRHLNVAHCYLDEQGDMANYVIDKTGNGGFIIAEPVTPRRG